MLLIHYLDCRRWDRSGRVLGLVDAVVGVVERVAKVGNVAFRKRVELQRTRIYKEIEQNLLMLFTFDEVGHNRETGHELAALVVCVSLLPVSGADTDGRVDVSETSEILIGTLSVREAWSF